MTAIDVVVMAAGKGTRMKSSMPKVLHPLAGRAMVQHVALTAAQLGARHRVFVIGHGAEQVEQALKQANPGQELSFVRQEPQLGTGHAVMQAMPLLPDDGVVVVLSGDVPLIRADTLAQLVQSCAGRQLALLTVVPPDPAGYGRVVRDAGGQVCAIVEQKDATPEQSAITEVYSGIMAAPAALLRGWLARLDNSNAQTEYYLTDVVKHAVAEGVSVQATPSDDLTEVAGLNSPAQLAELERIYQRRQAERLMEQGVRLIDPARFDLRGEVQCGSDVQIDINAIIEGRVVLGDGVSIGAHCVLSNCEIGAGAQILPYTHIDGEALGVRVGPGARIGPYARLRPGSDLGAEVHIGNFVEVKNSRMGAGSKANHLAYVGDTEMGRNVNYGAGSITANYDGANKHTTVIEDRVHVGSNCVIVAPVRLGAGGTIGGGSTITKDTPAEALTVARGKQISVANWKRPTKKTS
ncbi:MAG: bifunctional UDP-N-acetylglucosamine diphosphorylase/glucosamine-1-phosphate N-acetyltransferase GlmU [Alphaproteobacteria bacterium]|nr:bifunctional UDP-N-acetylglucosamine diphosphorylase/glucosamine-1-phosphate N-acetyltransferase GlmU [Alphaproteobacteria bacterium]